MDSFSLKPVYVFKKRIFCAAGKLKTLCIRQVSDWQKNYKNILVSIEKEKQKLALIVIF